MSGRLPPFALALVLLATPAFAYDFGLVKITQPAIGTGCYDIKSADLNGDGRADLVAAVFDSQRLVVAFGTVAGLSTPVYYPSGHADAVDLADFDGNGSIDIVEADWNENRVRLWLNQGDGTFVLNTTVSVSQNPRDVASGDFDGDGRRDIAVATGDGWVVPLAALPGGGFVGTNPVLLGGSTKGIAAGDLDNDGDLDLVTIDSSNRKLWRLRNDGGMSFFKLSSTTFSGDPSDVALGDLDGDGRLDAAASLENGLVAVVKGTDIVTPVVTFPIGSLSQSVAIADFDGDGSGDLLVSNYGVSTVQVLRNLGGLNFGNPVVTGVGTNPRAAAGGDFDADGRIDVVSGDFTAGVTTLLRNVPPSPHLSYSPPSLDFGAGVQGFPDVLTITLQNSGTSPLVVTPGAIDGSEFQYSSSTIPFTIQVGGLGTIRVRCLRSVVGVSTGTLHFATNDSLVPEVSVPLSASTALAHPEIGYFPTSLDFGTSYIGNQQNLAVTFQNTGNAQVTVTPGALEGSEFDFLAPHPAFTIQPGTSYSLPIRCKRSVVGDAQGLLHAATTDPNVPEITVPLSATTVQTLTKVTYTPQSLDFGTDFQGVTTTRTVSFTNLGNTQVTVTPGAIDGGQFVYAGSSAPITIAPTFTGSLTIRYQRSTVGPATGTLHVATNDPTQADISVPLAGTALSIQPKITCTPNPLDFGAKFDGVQQVLGVTVKNDGHSLLSVTPGAIEGDQFAYAATSAPFTVAAGATYTLPILYLRSVSGPASGTLHLASNDPDTPDATVALVGTSTPPPIAAFSAPQPITVSAGSASPAKLVVRNLGPTQLYITIPPGVGDLAETNAFDLGSTTQDYWRMSSSGALWNLDWEGRVVTGANDEYHWGMDESNFLVRPSGMLGLGGRELRLGPVAIAGGTTVTRKIYVPETGNWARFIDVAENSDNVPHTATFDLFDNIGYAPPGGILTSDGDLEFELSDDWIVIPADGDRRTTGRVFRSVGAANVPVVATWFQATAPGCYSRTKYVTTLAPHTRACVIQWAVQEADAAAAVATVEALRQNPAPGLLHADAVDRATAWNLVPAPQPFRILTSGPFTIAPGDSLEIPVTFGAEGATHDADLSALLRITTNDPQRAVLTVPLAFSIGNGQVVGVEPPQAPAAASLELAGFRPNPTRLSGTARISFRLATNEPATLTLYDVRGRQIARRAIETPQPGPGSLALTGTSLRAGVVWMRLEQGGRIATGKGIVLP